MKQGLSSECPACSSDGSYAGMAEWEGGLLYALFDCPQCDSPFTSWRPGFETLLAEDAKDLAGVIHALADRLCAVEPGDAPRLHAVVEQSGAEALLGVQAELDPGPYPCAAVDLKLRRWSPRFGHLEARFGAAAALPRTGAFASHVYSWLVSAPGARSSVSIFARFRNAAQPYSRPFGITLRLDPQVRST